MRIVRFSFTATYVHYNGRRDVMVHSMVYEDIAFLTENNS
jgi:hypothetical protein